MSLQGPTLKFKGGAQRWNVRIYTHWAKKEGTYLYVDLWAVGKIPREQMEKDTTVRRFVDELIRRFQKQKLVEPEEHASKKWGYPKFFGGLNFNRRRVPPKRLSQALNRLEDLSPDR